jgi:hypothetical protein
MPFVGGQTGVWNPNNGQNPNSPFALDPYLTPSLNPYGPSQQPPTGPGGGVGNETSWDFWKQMGGLQGNSYIQALMAQNSAARDAWEAQNQAGMFNANNMNSAQRDAYNAQLQAALANAGYQSQANLAYSGDYNRIAQQAAGMMSESQKQAGLGYMNPAIETARQGTVTGGITDSEFNQGISDVRQGVAESARALGASIQNALASRGIQNPMAAGTLGAAGAFAAGGQAGRARNQMNQARQQGRIAYGSQYGNLSQAGAGLASSPTQQSALAMQQYLKKADIPTVTPPPAWKPTDFKTAEPYKTVDPSKTNDLMKIYQDYMGNTPNQYRGGSQNGITGYKPTDDKPYFLRGY